MKIKHILCFAATLLLIALQLSLFISADDSTRITLSYAAGECDFDFYKIADLSMAHGFTPASPFDNYTDTVTLLNELDSLDAEEGRALASTLGALVDRDSIPPVFSGRTDADGKLIWDAPEQGLYLVIGSKTMDESYVYTPANILVSVPATDENGKLTSNVYVDHVKLEKTELENVTDVRVLKIWADRGNENERPTSVTAVLMKDGAEFDSVILDETNDWTYTWKELSDGHRWTVTEKDVPENYTMTVTRDGTVFVITNTYSGDGGGGGGDLPQTGQLWWPVPVLAFTGILFIIIGRLDRRSAGSSSETV